MPKRTREAEPLKATYISKNVNFLKIYTQDVTLYQDTKSLTRLRKFIEEKYWHIQLFDIDTLLDILKIVPLENTDTSYQNEIKRILSLTLKKLSWQMYDNNVNTIPLILMSLKSLAKRYQDIKGLDIFDYIHPYFWIDSILLSDIAMLTCRQSIDMMDEPFSWLVNYDPFLSLMLHLTEREFSYALANYTHKKGEISLLLILKIKLLQSRREAFPAEDSHNKLTDLIFSLLEELPSDKKCYELLAQAQIKYLTISVRQTTDPVGYNIPFEYIKNIKHLRINIPSDYNIYNNDNREYTVKGLEKLKAALSHVQLEEVVLTSDSRFYNAEAKTIEQYASDLVLGCLEKQRNIKVLRVDYYDGCHGNTYVDKLHDIIKMNLSIEDFSIINCYIDINQYNAIFKSLENCNNLKKLTVVYHTMWDDTVDVSTLSSLFKNSSQLTHITIQGEKSDADFENYDCLASSILHCQKLEFLVLRIKIFENKADNQLLKSLSKLKNLHTLSLDDVRARGNWNKPLYQFLTSNKNLSFFNRTSWDNTPSILFNRDRDTMLDMRDNHQLLSIYLNDSLMCENFCPFPWHNRRKIFKNLNSIKGFLFTMALLKQSEKCKLPFELINMIGKYIYEACLPPALLARKPYVDIKKSFRHDELNCLLEEPFVTYKQIGA